jgi:hypothetical protein
VWECSTSSQRTNFSDSRYSVALSLQISVNFCYLQMWDFRIRLTLRHIYTAADFLTSNPVSRKLLLVDREISNTQVKFTILKVVTLIPFLVNQIFIKCAEFAHVSFLCRILYEINDSLEYFIDLLIFSKLTMWECFITRLFPHSFLHTIHPYDRIECK